MADPLVSILISVYDSPVWFPDVLTNALSQTLQRIEVIVAITSRLLRPELKEVIVGAGPSVRHVIVEPGEGEGAMIRAAAELARGQYVAWAGGDDVADPRRIELQLTALTEVSLPAICSCGVRPNYRGSKPAPGHSHQPDVLPSLDRNATSVLKSLLDGRRDPQTLLIPRSCLDQVGGLDTSYVVAAQQFDLATRLAVRYPFVHLPANLVRRTVTAFPDLELREALREREQAKDRVWTRVLQSEATSVDEIAELASLSGRSNGSVLPVVQSRLHSLVSESDLLIAGLPRRDGQEADAEELKRLLGVPGAGSMRAEARDRNPLRLLAAVVAEENAAKWVILVDSISPPDPGAFAVQLTHAVSSGLDACLSLPDRVVYENTASATLIAGTLFRTAALRKLDWALAGTEREFWALLTRDNRVGAVPAEHNVTRPAVSSNASLNRVSMSDIVEALVDAEWYLRTYPDIARAGSNAVEHYLHHGWREGRNPNAWFSTTWYLERFPEALDTNISPLEHLMTDSAALSSWSRPGHDLRWFVRCRLEGTERTPEALLETLLPGIGGIASRAQLSVSAIYDLLGAVVPQFRRMLWMLQSSELPAIELLAALVDREWYLSTYPDVANARLDVVEHYLHHGWREGRDPNPWFDAAWYLQQIPEEGAKDRSPLEDFIKRGAAAGHQPHPGFHLQWYTRRYLPGTPFSAEALLHFLSTGAQHGAVPDPRLDTKSVRELLTEVEPAERPAKIRQLQARLPGELATIRSLVDREWYRTLNPDVAQAGVDVVEHYLKDGWRECRDPSPWFSTSWYMAQNRSVAEADICPLLHFVRTGAAAGLCPSRGFDTSWYARQYLDADSPSAAALMHFVTAGLEKGNVPHPRLHRPDLLAEVARTKVYERTELLRRLHFTVEREEQTAAALVDEGWYRARYEEPAANAAAHFREKGWRGGHNPNRWFDTEWYLKQNPDVRIHDVCPLDHFVRAGAAEGRKPHPLFEITWYAAKYLGGAKPGPEALLHFMNFGLNAGGAPDPRLATEMVRKRLLEVNVSERPMLIERLLEALSRTGAANQPFKAADADLWPLLLTRYFPPDTLPVLLLFEHKTGIDVVRAEAAAQALPVDESALFGILESETRLLITDQLGSDRVGVSLVLPDQLMFLKELLLALPCRRAAALGENPPDTPVIRAVRNAQVPVFTNSRGQ